MRRGKVDLAWPLAPGSSPLASPKRFDHSDPVLDLLRRQIRMNRQGERGSRQLFAYRKIPRCVPQLAKTRLLVQRQRVINLASYAVRLQMFLQAIAIARAANDELMVDVARLVIDCP